jgi:hypothetical protein
MFKLTKRIAIAATVVLAASAPSAAYARFIEAPATAPATAPAASWQAVQNAAPAPAASSQTVHTTAPPSAPNASASSSQDFHWDDAGIGAAGVLMLVSLGSGTMLIRRRRAQHPLTS